MTVKTYVLIETQPGKTNKIVNEIRELDGVLSADTVTGPYDAIAVIEGETLTEIGHILTDKIHSISGVTRSVTCVSV
jgi:DNA-binding Lrp family transcriptional regulator